MNPLLWTWRDEWLILPVVRGWVSRMAAACAWAVAAYAATAAAEIATGVGGFSVSVLFGLLTQAAGQLFFLLYLPLALWCHIVLLAGRGLPLTRSILLFCLLMAFVHLGCLLFTLCTGETLLAQQGLLPLLLALLLQLGGILNWGRLAAAPLLLKLRGMAVPLLWLCAYVTDAPETLPAAVFFKALLCLCVFVPLRHLAYYAPLIVSLPPQENSEEEEAHDATDR